MRVLPGGDEAVLSSSFVKGTAKAVGEALDANPGIRTLYLMSPGGLATEALAVAGMVRGKGLRTRVLHRCSSACTHVFAYGARREVRAGADRTLGFHSARVQAAWGRYRQGDRETTSGPLREAGVAGWFVDRVADTPFREIWYPDRDQLISGKVVDGTYGPYEGPGAAWTYEGLVERRARHAVPVWLAPSLERNAPAVLADIRAFLTRAGHDARNDRRIGDLWRIAAARVVARAVASAPDEVVVRAGGLIVSGMDAAGRDSSAVCARLGAAPDLVLAGMTVMGVDGTGPDAPWRTLAEAAFAAYGPGGWPDGISLPDVTDEATWAVRHGPDTPRETCAEMRRAYGDAVDKGDAAGAAWLRARFAAFAAGPACGPEAGTPVPRGPRLSDAGR